MGGMSIGNLPSQSILKKINDIAADVNDLDLEGVNNLKSKLSELVAPELGNSDNKAISQKIVTAIYNNADIFFCPEANSKEGYETYLKTLGHEKMDFVVVSTFSQAIEYLEGKYEKN